ncbi:MAG: TIM44-like domain-containing protein, partial [Actinobacteria bacterium]|nr:TIM44-like domain-containing protein [Actinomycetota bacterium]
MLSSLQLLASEGSLEFAVLLGRAGGGSGGGSFSGGGSSGGGGGFFGGSSGGGVGGGAGLAVLFFGGFGMWVVFMIIRMLIRRSQGGGMSNSGAGSTLPTSMAPAAMGETFGGGETARASTAVELTAGIDEIKTHDSAFDPDALITGLQASFYVVQQGWSERRPDLTRSVMADAIWNAHRMQIDGYTRSKQTNLMDGLAIQYANLVAASCDGHHDSIVIRFFVQSADYVTDDQT